MSQYLSETLKTLTPTCKVLTEQETLTRINKQGLGVEYTRMRGDAEQSHLLDRHSLAKIGAALGVATVMNATGSFDHRAIDGADGARLMQAFKQLVENPLGMLA